MVHSLLSCKERNSTICSIEVKMSGGNPKAVCVLLPNDSPVKGVINFEQVSRERVKVCKFTSLFATSGYAAALLNHQIIRIVVRTWELRPFKVIRAKFNAFKPFHQGSEVITVA